LTAPSSNKAIRAAFLLRTLPAMPWISDQVLGLSERGVGVSVLAERYQSGDTFDPAQVAYRDRVRLLGQAEGSARRALELASDAARALPFRPADTVRMLGRGLGVRPRAGSFPLRMALAARVAGADVLHAHFANFADTVLPIRRLTGLPLVVSCYGWDVSAAPRGRPEKYEALFRESAAVVSLSKPMNAILRDLGCPPEKMEIVHISVRGERLRRHVDEARRRQKGSPPAEGALRVLAAARLVEKKGLDDALEALARLSQRGVPFIFRIVGDGPLRTDLEARAAALGLADRVVFTGRLDREAVFTEMARADVFLLPSRTDASGDQEGTPTALIEACAVSIPCVSTLHAGIPEIILDGETGLLVPERDVAGLADRLERLAGDPELRARLGRAARARMDAEFDLDSQCARLESIYQRCAGRTA
jgi:glycosyltransferase involved in cell wall biosynthesis